MVELQEEQKEINFKNFFFEALQQKAIGNYEKAIMALEYCQNIQPGNMTVFFELGKNYFELGNFVEAENYTKKAVELDSGNKFVLLLLRDIYNKQGNFKDALEIQEKIVALDPNQQVDLVLLYIKNNRVEEARELLLGLDKKGMLSENLVPFKESLLKGTVSKPVETSGDIELEQQTIEQLKALYGKDGSYATLKFLLLKMYSKKDFLSLESESSKALELFPAQPLLYFMNGSALNQQKQYEKALKMLLDGLDYVVDDPDMEADFYDEIGFSYKGLGQNINAAKYYEKAHSLKQKKS